jgi:hypothetical protein
MHKYTKTVLAVVGALGMSSGASSEEQGCETIKTIAESTMTARQREVDILQVLALVEKHFGSAMEAIAKDIVIDAYEKPGWASEERRNKAVKEFTNQWTLACVKSLRENN